MAQAIKGETIDLIVKVIALCVLPVSGWAFNEISNLKQGHAILEHSYHDSKEDMDELKDGQKSIKNCLVQMQLDQKCDFR